ncbi:MAG: L-rhamnose mutarotase [Tannerella sp.]|nr:L-rhamnose mutarotase [Tannerella sp.]
MEITGYKTKQHAEPVKRYCQTLNLKNDPALIAKYVRRHSDAHVWPEIREGIRSAGILEMEIYLLENRLFMIVETPLDFDWDEAFAKLAALPRQQEWEDYMSIFQDVQPDATSAEKWKQMKRIFQL